MCYQRFKIYFCLINLNITLLVQGLRAEYLTPPPLYTCHDLFSHTRMSGGLEIHVSHMTCGCKESEYEIQKGRPSVHFWPF